MSNSFDFEEFKAQTIEQLKAGVPLSGKNGVLAPLLENLLNSALEGEMDCHLEGVEHELGNRRNGHMSKQVQTSMGEITINTPRGRDGTFDPQVVRKREKILADSLADRIIGLCNRQQHKREKRHPGGTVRQPHICDHKQHCGPCSSRDTELEKPASGAGLSHCVA